VTGSSRDGGSNDDPSDGDEDPEGGKDRPAPWRDMDRLTESEQRDRKRDAESSDEEK
jgi:hypothetical protein